MGEAVYDASHVLISRLVGRQYNNPLGEAAFPVLRRLIGDSFAPPRVLDVGCGRGRTALWWARQGARVVAFDPSSAMLAEAQRLLEESALAGAVSLSCTDLAGFHPAESFDLAIVHDVLCYSGDRTSDLGRILSLCRPGGFVSVTDYFGDVGVTSVEAIVGAWGIRPTLGFSAYSELLSSLGGELLLLCDTTRQYGDHWASIKERVATERKSILAHVRADAIDRFEHQIGSIERALADRHFGHLWAIIQKPAPGRQERHVDG